VRRAPELPAVNDLDKLGIDASGPLVRVVLDHPSSRSSESDERIWNKIEAYLTENKIMYAWLDPASAPEGGMIVWLPEVNVHGDYPEKNEELMKISNLGAFLFEKLKLHKGCLHFTFTEIGISGDGKCHETWEAIDEVCFEELTGQTLPPEAKPRNLEESINGFREQAKEK